MIEFKTKPYPIQILRERFSGFIEFGRPHTLIGTSIAIMVIYLIYSPYSLVQTLMDGSVYFILSVALATNYYIVGLNQITDIGIDTINKPYLPLPAGKLTLLQAKFITVFSSIYALISSWISGQILGLTITLSLLIGTVYSLKPIHLKNRRFAGPFSIIVVRAILINLGISYHIQLYYHINDFLNRQIIYLLIIILLLSAIISLMKDIPDFDGDSFYQINTMVVTYGELIIYRICQFMLIVLPIIGGILSIVFWQSLPLLFLHIFIMLVIALKLYQTNILSNDTIISLYKFIWYLFYLFYLIPILEIVF